MYSIYLWDNINEVNLHTNIYIYIVNMGILYYILLSIIEYI